jgi:ketosteroid isomerase-like protein
MTEIHEAAATATDAETVGRRFIDALNAGDADALDRLFADNISWTFLGDFPFSGKHEGKTAVFNDFLAPAGGLFDRGSTPTPPIELRNVVARGNLVALEYIARLKTKIGNDYENKYVLMVEVEDGKIVNVREYNDTQYLKNVCY